MSKKMSPASFGLKITNLLVFTILSRKSVFRSRLHRVCVGGMGRAQFSQFVQFSVIFYYVGVFGNLSDPVIPTLRGATGDVVTVHTS